MKRLRLDRPLPSSSARPEPKSNADELTFEELMARDGVERLDDPGSRKQQTKALRVPVAEKQVSQPSASQLEDLPSEGSIEAVQGDLADAQVEIERLKKAMEALDAQNRDQVAQLEKQNGELEARIQVLDGERRALSRKLGSAPRKSGSARTLSSLFEKRGARDPQERTSLIQGLIEGRKLGRLLELATVTEAPALAAVLDAAVSFVCSNPTCQEIANSHTIPVDPPRCEVCGGSDLRAAASALFRACTDKGLNRIRIVGGAPSYHTRLKELASGTEIELKCIPGDVRRTEKQAREDQKHSHLVILWGGTILDHATSNLYDKNRSAVVTVANRGLAGMLVKSREMVESRGPS
ncbi:MAG: hypothetical protein P8K76_12845 [Candidatus Binatia bacterium]|nr:hypothetical protein [Candidatus Binatia bacterium]